MKKLINLFAIAGIACLATVACTKDGPDGPQPKPQGLTAPTLSVSPSSVVVAEESEDIALTFTWNDVSAEGITPVYGFQVTKKGDSEFASGTAFECPSTEKKFSHAELAALASEHTGVVFAREFLVHTVEETDLATANAYVTSRDILVGTNAAPKLEHERLAETHYLGIGFTYRIKV